jgi:hypothetical protein
MINMNWVAIKLNDILLVLEVLEAYRAHHGASLLFGLRELCA